MIKNKILTAAVCGLILFCLFASFKSISAINVGESDIEELRALIQKLQEQIKQLQAKLAEKESASVSWCHDFSANLRIGDKGSEIIALHTALKKEDSKTPLNAEDDNFTEITASGVTAFQQKYAKEILAPLGLKYGTGFVGPATRTKLNQLYGCGVRPSPTFTPKPTPTYTPKPTPTYTPKPTPTVKSSIKVYFPKGGDVWKIGETYAVKWTSSGVPKIKIMLSSKAGDTHTVDVEAGTEAYSFTVPSHFPAGKAKLYVMDAYDSSVFGMPDGYIFVETATPTPTPTVKPSISVKSPEAGDVWNPGGTYIVSWTSSGVSETIIRLSSITGTMHTVDVMAGTEAYNFTVPSYFPAGKAKLYVIDARNSYVFGMPDGYIFVETATPTPTVNP